MTIAWLLYVLVVGSLLAVAARALASALGGVGRPTRWVWTGALAGLAALAIVAPTRPTVENRAATLSASAGRGFVSAPAARPGLVARLHAVSGVVADGAISVLASLEHRVPRAAARTLLASWAVASVVLLALWTIVNLRLARARRGWPVHRVHGVSIRVAPATGPAVLGLIRPDIVMPRSLLERGADEQRMILAHEREHLGAGDPQLLAGAWLVAIALPWHPAVWYLLARLRLAIELDCDARVLRRGVPPRSYGALLIDVAAHHGGIRIGALALADGPSHLERRIRAMHRGRTRHGAARGALLATVGGLLVLAACEAKMPTSAEIDAMDVASAQRSASQAGFIRTPSGDRTDFFVNGVKVSAEQARAMEAKIIGSIEVVKSELPTGRDTIFVTTSDRMPKGATLMATRVSTVRGESEQTFVKMKRTADSAEKMVAHVESELAGERMRVRESGAAPTSARQSLPRRTMSRGEDAPLIMIDGKRASEEELAALNEKEIASMAVYKGRDALNLTDDGKQGLEVTSRPADRAGATSVRPVISVTTKAAKARANKQP